MAARLVILASVACCVRAHSDDDDGDGNNDVSLSLKLIALFSLLVAAIIGGVIPVYWRKLRENSVLLAHVNAFAGGVFLSMALNHLLPEADEGFREHSDMTYPLAYTIALCGYSLVLMIEKVVVNAHSLVHVHESKSKGKRTKSTHVHISSGNMEDDIPKNVQDMIDDPAFRASVFARSSLLPEDLDYGTDTETPASSSPSNATLVLTGGLPVVVTQNTPLLHSQTGGQIVNFGSTMSPTNSPRLGSPAHSSRRDVEVKKPESDHDHDHDHDDAHGHSHGSGAPKMAISAYLLMIALSLHSVFEGIALGVQQSDKNLITLFIGILSHKWAEAVALATSFIRTRRSARFGIICMFIFSLASPIGVGIGIGISSTGNELMISVFMSLAAGTFLYVGANEVVAEEFETLMYRRSKFLCFLLGAGGICALALLHQG